MANPSSPPKPLIVQEDDLFYFESDHLALKGNNDYSNVLKTIFILEAQQSRAIKDYDKVIELHKQALENPQLFLDKLKNGESLGVPDLQVIAEIPTIDWTKYPVKIPDEGLKFLNEKSNQNILSGKRAEENNGNIQMIDTHNKPWTTEEQKRLEELLVIYPPEPIEFRRFKKIAAALGNRTVQQVSSRIQKYFIKLYKAGLPIPGRIPKYAERCKKSKLHLHQKYNHYLFKPTTFFPQFDLPVVIDEAQEVPGPSSTNGAVPGTSTSSNYLMPDPTIREAESIEEDLPSEEPKDEINLQIQLLQKVKAEKQNSNDLQLSFQHYGYRCDYCDEEPVTGTRWHCATCDKDSIDFCSDCVISQMYSGNAHPVTHRLEPVQFENTPSASCNSSSESVSGSTYNSSNRKHKSSDGESANNSDSEDIEQNDEQSMESYDLSNVTLKYESDNELESSEFDIKEEPFGNMYDISKDDNQEITFVDEVDMEDDLEEKDYSKEEINMRSESDMFLYTGHDDENEEGTEQHNSNAEMFTETQTVAYSYLHSRLLDESIS